MSPFLALLTRDMRLAVRVGGGALMGALFYFTVVAMMPFAIGPDLNLLARIGPAILWLGALLASLLALDRLFATDHDDGSLDLLMMVIVGGSGHFLGPFLGAMIAVLLPLWLCQQSRAPHSLARRVPWCIVCRARRPSMCRTGPPGRCAVSRGLPAVEAAPPAQPPFCRPLGE